MEWPSKNVPYGGILHPAKTTTFSPETQKFLKVLMDESKMTIRQRRQVDYCLRNGEPLPAPTEFTSNKARKANSLLLERETCVTINPGPSKRRSQHTIMQSGAYEREKFKRQEPLRNRELEKQKLQDKMAFGCDKLVGKKLKATKLPEECKVDEEFSKFEQLTQEIRERQEWLKEMEALGDGDKYRLLIQQQVHERIKQIEKLKIDEKLC